jgi:hypothetical protein
VNFKIIEWFTVLFGRICQDDFLNGVIEGKKFNQMLTSKRCDWRDLRDLIENRFQTFEGQQFNGFVIFQ